MRWFVHDASGFYELLALRAVNMTSVAEFVIAFDLINTDGTFRKNHDAILFESKTLFAFSSSDFFVVKTDEASVPLHGMKRVSSVEEQVYRHLDLFSRWLLFTKTIHVVGPVSMSYVTNASKDVMLLGDVHDNLSAGPLSDDQVRTKFQGFFRASQSFYAQPSDFGVFARFVHDMRFLPFAIRNEPDPNMVLFVWEFLVLWMHLIGSEPHDAAVDVILEAPLQSDYAVQNVDTYLDAVRYLFSVCPSIHDADSPFAHFQEPCKRLFPSTTIKRIDLRFALTEQPKGAFLHGEPLHVIQSISTMLMLVRKNPAKKKRDFVAEFAAVLRLVHGTTDTDDEKLLLQEVFEVVNVVRKTPVILSGLDAFLDVLFGAVRVHWVPNARSPWFLFRTCLTDIYGLATLLRSSQRRTIAYLGDYHVKVWTDVLVQFATFDLIRSQVTDPLRREVVLPNHLPKPLLFFPNWSAGFSHALSEYYHDAAPRAMQNGLSTFFSLMNTIDRDTWLVDYFVNIATNKSDRAHVWWTHTPQAFVPWKKRAQRELAAREMLLPTIESTCKGVDHDIFQTEFRDMTSAQLAAVYLNEKGNCVSAFGMWEWWKECAKEGRVLRDPVTRAVVTNHEQATILRLVGQREAPPKHTNPPNWVVTQLPDGSVALRVGFTSYTVLYLPTYQEPNAPKGAVFVYSVLREVLRSIAQLELRDGQVFHPSIHFNLFRNKQLWVDEPDQTLRRLQEELTPFTIVVF